MPSDQTRISEAAMRCLRYYARGAAEGNPRCHKEPEGWVTTAYSRTTRRGIEWESDDYMALIDAGLIEQRDWTWKDNLTRPTEAGYDLLLKGPPHAK